MQASVLGRKKSKESYPLVTPATVRRRIGAKEPFALTMRFVLRLPLKTLIEKRLFLVKKLATHS